MAVKIEESWHQVLESEFKESYFRELTGFVRSEIAAGKVVYPPGPLIFNAFNRTPFAAVRVVVLGQDPYIRPGEAMGLSFSVPKGVRIPPSLQNIFKELNQDIGCPIPRHGDLTAWADQGVFLLNAALTVEKGMSNSHAKCGWHRFTDAVIRTLSAEKNGLVFLLWGNFARQKKTLVDTTRHLVLEAAHPSPLAGGAFYGCRHFSKANRYLADRDLPLIDWCLEE
ncbi:MAG: hypothetical protein RLY31_2038 [Bacteroidota bacterium]|jgi:uracil-DNA glycosylase